MARRISLPSLLLAVLLSACAVDPIHGPEPVADDVVEGLDLSARVSASLRDDWCRDLPPADDPLEVRTTRATVRGAPHPDGGFAWKGIRFGAPPVGERRFAPTALPDCAPVVVDAVDDPPQCFQAGFSGDVAVGQEDCLFLNVFRPERRDDDPARLPVLFWIHGGGQILGSGLQPAAFGNLYEGAELAERARAVVVSVNYRLGAFGFLAHESLRGENGAVGNWAHHDLLTALRWTQDNIAGFGGDPGKVTIFGESAGAHNVAVLIASAKAKGLFHGAILQSGGYEVAPLADRLAEGATLAEKVGCAPRDGDGNGGETDADVAADIAACLRDVDAGAIFLNIPPTPPLLHVWWLPFGSTVDGEILTDQPLDVIRRGEHNAVPVVVGSNRDEINLFLAFDVPLTCFDLRLQLEVLLGPSFDTVEARDDAIDAALEAYRCGERLVTRDVLVEAATDLVFTCHARRLSRALQAAPLPDDAAPPPVFRYHFRDQANYGALLPLGAFHAWDLAYVFGNFEQLAYLPSDGERELSRHLMRAWGRIAHTGSPSDDVGDDPRWAPSVDDGVLIYDEDPFASFGGEAVIRAGGDPSPSCDLWDRYAY